jgi:hypothetical protein
VFFFFFFFLKQQIIAALIKILHTLNTNTEKTKAKIHINP